MIGRPWLAAFLSFLWPGLGQAYQHDPRRAIIQALPQFLAVGLLVLVLMVMRPIIVVAYLLNPLISIGLLVVVVLLGLWHAWSIGDAIGWPRIGRNIHVRSPVGVRLWAIALVCLVLVVHGWVGYHLLAFYRVSNAIYDAPPIGIVPAPGARQPSRTLAPGATPGPTG